MYRSDFLNRLTVMDDAGSTPVTPSKFSVIINQGYAGLILFADNSTPWNAGPVFQQGKSSPRTCMAKTPKEKREAHRLKMKRWRDADPEKYREYQRKWHRENTAKRRAAGVSPTDEQRKVRAIRLRAWRKANPEKEKAKTARWRKKHTEHCREYQRNYQKTHREQIRESNNRRRALVPVQAITVEQIKNLFQRQNGLCAYYATCGNTLGKSGIRGAHQDHIEPLNPKEPDREPGKHSIDNIQLLCGSCNSKKGNKDPYAFTQAHDGRLFPDLPRAPKKKANR